MGCPVHEPLELEVARAVTFRLVDAGQLPPLASKAAPFNEEAAETLASRLDSVFDGLDDEIAAAVRAKGVTENPGVNATVARALASRAKRARDLIVGTGVEVAERARGEIIVDIRRGRPDAIIDDVFPQRVRDRIVDREKVFADKSLQRISDDISEALAEGYDEGLGIDDIVNQKLQPQVDSVRNSRLPTIARTEVQGSQNDIRHNTMRELDVAYEQWITALDPRVRGSDPRDRADHVILHGEVVDVGGNFSNGLRYPGDRSGAIEKWINCRCLSRPYFPGPNEVITSTPFVA